VRLESAVITERQLYGFTDVAVCSPSTSQTLGGPGIGSERQPIDDLGPYELDARQQEEDCWVI